MMTVHEAPGHAYRQAPADIISESFGEVFNLDWVESGFSFTPLYGDPAVVVSPGTAYTVPGNEGYALETDGEVELDLPEGARSHIHVVYVDGSTALSVEGTAESAYETSVYLGYVDTSSDAYSEVNRGSEISPDLATPTRTVSEMVSADETDTTFLETRNPINSKGYSRVKWTHQGRQFSSFNPDDWAVSTEPATFDTDTYFNGRQSVRITANSQLRYHFDTTEDMTGLSPCCAVRMVNSELNGEEVPSQIRLDMVDGNGNRRRFEAQFSTRGIGNDWFMVDLNHRSVDSSWDGTAVNFIQLNVPGDRDTGFEMWIDNLRMVPQSDNQFVMIGFDDVWERDREAFEIFTDYGITPYFAINGGAVGGDAGHEPNWEKATMEDLQWIYDRGGVFLNHTYNHENPHQEGIEAFEEGIRKQAKWMFENDFRNGENIFVWPGGDPSPEALEVVEKYFDMALGAGSNHINLVGSPLQTSQPLRSIRMDFDDDMQSALDFIDKADNGHVDVAELFGHTHQQGPTEWENLAQKIADSDLIPITPVDYLEFQNPISNWV